MKFEWALAIAMGATATGLILFATMVARIFAGNVSGIITNVVGQVICLVIALGIIEGM